jgi:outer membrane translocation and assembly module TamA
MKGALRIIYVSCFFCLLLSCSSTKFVDDGKYLLDKVYIESDNRKYKPADLKPYLRQQPNFKSFGLMKWQLYLYNWSGRDDKKWINKQLRRMGEAPVIMDTTLIEQSMDELGRFLMNKGYVNAEVSVTIDTGRPKKAAVTYRIESGTPYTIRNYAMKLDDPVVDSIARLKAPVRSRFAAAFRSTPDGYIPLVSEENLFDRDVLDMERQRITTLLRRRGYYAFNRDNLGYLADSSFSQNVVDLEMILKPYRQAMPDGSIVERPHRRYYIKDVTILTDYDPLLQGESGRFMPADSVKTGNISIVYGQNGRSIRPAVLHRSNYIIPGNAFNERSLEQTYSSFAALNSLRNVNIRFSEVEENDTLKLKALILTAPAKVHGFGIDLEGTNSAGDLGFASSVNYKHRNLFKGSELFSMKIRGAYESLRNMESGLRSYWEIGGEASVTFPHFMFPFLSENLKRKLRASTEFNVSYNRQTRPEYERAILSGSWRYNWQDRTNTFARHSIRLVDIDYLFLPRINQSFLDSLPETTRYYNYHDQFIVSSGYSYTFNNYNPQYRQRGTHSLRASIEMAGNILYALSHLTGAEKDEDGRYKLFGINYSQYVKGDFDYNKGIALDSKSRLAFHVGVGVALPYGNGEYIPFERRYFSGGANSVRGWSVRSLGPGSMPTDSATFFTQSGDIRLDVNIEYRTKLFWKFELATYVDAGNIWTIRPYADQKNGNFDFSRFYREIAFSYGLGIRLDFDFFLIRLDSGFKAYNPQAHGYNRWAITRPNFKDNFALHFAVGYPF